MFFCNILLQQYLLKEDINSFYELNLQDFCEILSCLELQISSELELFNAAVDWINYKTKKRRKHMNKFLKLIKLPLLSSKILTDLIKKHKLCRSCINCKDTIDNAIKSKQICAEKTSNNQFQNRYYSCHFENSQIMFAGGIKYIFESETLNYIQSASLYTFDGINLIKSQTTSKMHQLRINCKTAAIGSKVYCFGSVDANGKEL